MIPKYTICPVPLCAVRGYVNFLSVYKVYSACVNGRQSIHPWAIMKSVCKNIDPAAVFRLYCSLCIIKIAAAGDYLTQSG